jgi:predicted RNA binding protein YcfA (HicA-like mRNA interferase family)
VVAVVEALGFVRARRESHDTYVRPGHRFTVSIPRGRKEMSQTTLTSIWRQAGITSAIARKTRKAAGR